MEVDSIVEMFIRSIVKFGVKYLNYIGDGDSKTFASSLKILHTAKIILLRRMSAWDTYKNVWVHGYGIKRKQRSSAARIA